MLAGVPSLLFPGGDFERYFNSRQAAKLGAARNLPSQEFTSDRMLQHLDELLESSYAQDAAAAGERLRVLGGGCQYSCRKKMNLIPSRNRAEIVRKDTTH
jgi:UDP:flavonoid glycosyltransferase YjiC (YdhE family)